MFRRVVCLLLLPTLLLTQWATVAQCQCRHVSNDEGRSHIHLASLSFTDSIRKVDVHEHQNQGCTHNHGDEDNGDEDDSGPADPDDDSHEHDVNRILYVPASPASGWIIGRLFSAPEDAGDLPDLAFSNGLLIHVPSLVKAHHSPPFSTPPDCPTFLRNLALLI